MDLILMQNTHTIEKHVRSKIAISLLETICTECIQNYFKSRIFLQKKQTPTKIIPLNYHL